MPAGMKVLENVTEGEVPGDALEMYRTLDREYQAASMMTDLKMGFFPPRAVKATEVLEASQSQAVTLDGMVGDIERSLIVPTLEKAYLNILQHLEVLDARDVVAAIGPQAALQLARMTAPERFAALARKATFQVHGISATLGKVRDFQKTMAFMAAVSQSPVLLQAFQARFSADKMLTSIMKTLNLNPEQLEMTPEERAQAPQRMAQMAALQGILSGAPTAGIAAPVAGDSEVPAEIAQTANPMTGMAGP
jgi:hypothetical protein